MFVLGPDRLLGLGQVRVPKRANRDTDEFGHPCGFPPDIRSTTPAEMEYNWIPARGLTLELLGRSAHNADSAAFIEDRDTERAARSTLAFDAVAHRDTSRITGAGEFELAAVATSRTGLHGLLLDPL